MRINTLATLALASSVQQVLANSKADTRYGTRPWIGGFLDEDNCGKADAAPGCFPTEAELTKLLTDQFDAAFEELCQSVSCEGSFGIKNAGNGCQDSKKLSGTTNYELKLEAEFTEADRGAVKEAFMNTLTTLNMKTKDCGKFDDKGLNSLTIDIPTDINIVRDDGDGGLASTMHIFFDTTGPGACDLVDAIWGAIGGVIPGGELFGEIAKGLCK